MSKFCPFFLILFLLTGCFNNTDTPPSDVHQGSSITTSTTSYASHAFPGVKWNDVIYMITDETVDETKEALGTVSVYSTDELEAVPNGYSNFYPEGTELWSIPDVDPTVAIAVQAEQGSFFKAVSITHK